MAFRGIKRKLEYETWIVNKKFLPNEEEKIIPENVIIPIPKRLIPVKKDIPDKFKSREYYNIQYGFKLNKDEIYERLVLKDELDNALKDGFYGFGDCQDFTIISNGIKFFVSKNVLNSKTLFFRNSEMQDFYEEKTDPSIVWFLLESIFNYKYMCETLIKNCSVLAYQWKVQYFFEIESLPLFKHISSSIPADYYMNDTIASEFIQKRFLLKRMNNEIKNYVGYYIIKYMLENNLIIMRKDASVSYPNHEPGDEIGCILIQNKRRLQKQTIAMQKYVGSYVIRYVLTGDLIVRRKSKNLSWPKSESTFTDAEFDRLRCLLNNIGIHENL